MAEPFLPAHDPADDDLDRPDMTISDDDVIIEPGTPPGSEDVKVDAEEAPVFRAPVVGDRLTADELAAELERDEPAN